MTVSEQNYKNNVFMARAHALSKELDIHFQALKISFPFDPLKHRSLIYLEHRSHKQHVYIVFDGRFYLCD